MNDTRPEITPRLLQLVPRLAALFSRNQPHLRDEMEWLGWVQLWYSWRTWRPDGGASLETYTYRYVALRLRDCLRRRRLKWWRKVRLPSQSKRAEAVLSDAEDAHEPQYGDEAVANRVRVQHLLGGCTREQREAVRLVYFQGMSADEAGAHLGVTGNAIRSRLFNAMRRMRADSLTFGGKDNDS